MNCPYDEMQVSSRFCVRPKSIVKQYFFKILLI